MANANLAFLQALSLQGGGLNAVARLGAAAYLDSLAIKFQMSPSAVITLVNDAFAHNDPNYNGALMTLQTIMNSEDLGLTSCPLN